MPCDPTAPAVIVPTDPMPRRAATAMRYVVPGRRWRRVLIARYTCRQRLRSSYPARRPEGPTDRRATAANGGTASGSAGTRQATAVGVLAGSIWVRAGWQGYEHPDRDRAVDDEGFHKSTPRDARS
jgi:hypothetical protein